MEIVKHQQLKATLSTVKKDTLPNLFLICGEAFLVRSSFKILADTLLGENPSSFSMDKIDGLTVPLGDIIEQVSTFSFPASQKIFAVTDMPLFATDRSTTQIRYKESDFELMESFIQNGWPDDHTLVLLAHQSDKRKKIYKIIAGHGWIIDCTVPQGARKVDQEEQLAVLRGLSDAILKKRAKQLDPQAFRQLVELTGFNLDLFSQNLDKLVAYASERSLISTDDVSAVIVRDKKDPIFNLTNAVQDKNTKEALFYLNALAADGFHPLQFLKSFENLYRKLIYTKDTLLTLYPEGIHLGQMSFNQFKQSVLPKLVEQDNQRIKEVETLELLLTGSPLKKKDIPKELKLVANPKNAYPVFQTCRQADQYSLDELFGILIFLSDLDFQMKTSTFDIMTQIENFIIKLSAKGGFQYAQKNKDYRHNF